MGLLSICYQQEIHIPISLHHYQSLEWEVTVSRLWQFYLCSCNPMVFRDDLVRKTARDCLVLVLIRVPSLWLWLSWDPSDFLHWSWISSVSSGRPQDQCYNLSRTEKELQDNMGKAPGKRNRWPLCFYPSRCRVWDPRSPGISLASNSRWRILRHTAKEWGWKYVLISMHR